MISMCFSDVPLYPSFVNLGIKHKPIFDRLQSNFPGISEVDFPVQFAWEAFGFQTQIAVFKDNLLIKAKDVTDGKFENIICPVSNENLLNSEDILQYLNFERTLGPIPFEFIKKSEITKLRTNKGLKVKYDRNNYDYILSSKNLAELVGGKYKSKRYIINRFRKAYPNHTTIIAEGSDVKKYLNKVSLLNDHWSQSKQINSDSIVAEKSAIEKIILNAENYHLILIGVEIKGKLIGYSINHEMPHGYIISSFGKYDPSIEGIAPFVEHVGAIYFYKNNFHYINNEQDLGISSLRASKKSWHPIAMKKKYKFIVA